MGYTAPPARNCLKNVGFTAQYCVELTFSLARLRSVNFRRESRVLLVLSCLQLQRFTNDESAAQYCVALWQPSVI